jgi:DNA invertase Pin-like site-specific DNA recombinase
VEKSIRVIILKQNLYIHQHDMNSKIIITLLSLFGELERDLVSLRTKEALSAKKSARPNPGQTERDNSKKQIRHTPGTY